MRRVGCCLLAFVLSPLMTATAASAAGQPVDRPAAKVESQDRGALSERLLHRMGKSLASALEGEEMRARLHKMLGESPYVEGRIALKRLLGEDKGLRSTLIGGKSAEEWSTTSAALPELELYFPARKHRSEWTGGPAIDVAVALGNTGRYRVYSPDGSVRDFDGRAMPERPTLLLGRSEIDYDDVESAMVGGRRTGPFLEQLAKELAQSQGCDPGSAQGDTPSDKTGDIASLFEKGADTAYETTLTLIRIKNDYEPWIRGSMEIEVFGNVDGSHGACTRITDVDEDRDYTYALGARRVANAAPTDPSTVNISIYEDDDSGCSVQSGDDYIGGASQSAGQLGSRQYYTNFDLTLQSRLKPVCGNFVCETGESAFCCDCSSCGDFLCNTGCGESYSSCYYDCSCGDFYCDFHEDYWSCPQDCTCGNFYCDFGEDSFNCPQDCPN